MVNEDAAQPDHDSVAAWFSLWGDFVSSVDFAAARELFDDAVIGFGTYMDTVVGLDRLEAQQWRSIWPTIKNFRFEVENLHCVVSPDRLTAVGIVTWSSTGFDQSGDAYNRPGRATVALERKALTASWLGKHTHLSEFPRQVQKSFGAT